MEGAIFQTSSLFLETRADWCRGACFSYLFGTFDWISWRLMNVNVGSQFVLHSLQSFAAPNPTTMLFSQLDLTR